MTGWRKKAPRFVDDENLEGGRRRFLNDGVRAVEDVEEQRFQLVRNFVHAFKVEGLKAREREMVFYIVEEGRIGAALYPLLQLSPERSWQYIGKRRRAGAGPARSRKGFRSARTNRALPPPPCDNRSIR